MITAAEARRLALALPDAIEQDHHGFPSYRVGGKIFATAPDASHLNVFVAVEAVPAIVATAPGACSELRWGRRLCGVQVELRRIAPEMLAELLEDAWRLRARAQVKRKTRKPRT